MNEYNSIMIAAIATPSGLPVQHLEERAFNRQLKTRLSFEGVRISEVQWPYRLDTIRFLDEENHLYRLDWKSLLNAEIEPRLYEIDEILDCQAVISRSHTAMLLASMENHAISDDPQTTLEGHLEFIVGRSDRVVRPHSYQEFLAIYAKYEQRVGLHRLHTLIQAWKGTPPKGTFIRWKGDTPYLVEPSKHSRKGKRSFNRSVPSGLVKRHRSSGHRSHNTSTKSCCGKGKKKFTFRIITYDSDHGTADVSFVSEAGTNDMNTSMANSTILSGQSNASHNISALSNASQNASFNVIGEFKV